MHHLIYFTDILEALLREERLKNLQTTKQIIAYFVSNVLPTKNKHYFFRQITFRK